MMVKDTRTNILIQVESIFVHSMEVLMFIMYFFLFLRDTSNAKDRRLSNNKRSLNKEYSFEI